MSRSDGVVSVPLRCSGCDASFTLHLLVHYDGPVPDREPLCPSCLVDDDDDNDNDNNSYSSTSGSGSGSSFDYAISTVLITEGSFSCAVCMEELELGCFARRLTCSHMYHSECILPWLSCRNSCPLCRSRTAAMAEEIEEAVDDRRVTLSLGPDGEAAAAAAAAVRLPPAGGRPVGL